MDINEVSTIYEVIRQLSERVKAKGCKEGSIKEETCKYIFDDFDDWCNICALETAIYFLNKSVEVNEMILNEGKNNANRQTNQRTSKISNGNGGSSSKS